MVEVFERRRRFIEAVDTRRMPQGMESWRSESGGGGRGEMDVQGAQARGLEREASGEGDDERIHGLRDGRAARAYA